MPGLRILLFNIVWRMFNNTMDNTNTNASIAFVPILPTFIPILPNIYTNAISYSNAYANANAYTYANTYANANAYANPNAYT